MILINYNLIKKKILEVKKLKIKLLMETEENIFHTSSFNFNRSFLTSHLEIKCHVHDDRNWKG